MYLLSIVQTGVCRVSSFIPCRGKSGVWKHKGLAIIFSRITPAGSSLSDVRAFPENSHEKLDKTAIFVSYFSGDRSMFLLKNETRGNAVAILFEYR